MRVAQLSKGKGVTMADTAKSRESGVDVPGLIAALRLALAFSLAFALAPGHAQTVAGFTPDSFRVSESGAAVFTVPMQVPPGVAGMEPKLAFVYNSKVGNGLLGMGWGLSGLSAITRCPRTIVQDGVKAGVKFSRDDRFCLDGQRLVMISPSPAVYGGGGSEYRTEREGFTKVISNGSADGYGGVDNLLYVGPDSFKVWTKAGQILEYGKSSDSRIEASNSFARVARVWALNKIYDKKGNFVTISYAKDVPNGDFYPTRIDYNYTITATTGDSPSGTDPAASVQFFYEPRTDVAPAYIAGSVIKTQNRLINVKTYAGVTLVKDYRLAYDNSASTGRSTLNNLKECDAAAICLAPIALNWQAGGDATFAHWTSSNPNVGTQTGGSYYQFALADVNGDGKTDLIQISEYGNGGWVGLANGDGSFTYWTSSSASVGQTGAHFPGSASCCEAGNFYTHYFADVNGDGCADWIQVQNNDNNAWVGLSHCDGTFTYWTSSTVGVVGAVLNYTHFFADVNGDGCADWIQVARGSNDGWVGISNCNGSFTYWVSTSTSVGAAGLLYGQINGAYYTHFFADVNGDGCADWIQVANTANSGSIALSNCDGTFTYWTSTSSSVGAAGYYRHYFADVNGDGCADWIQVAMQSNNGWIGLSNCDGTFNYWTSSTVSVGATDNYYGGSVGTYYAHYFADVNGDGCADWIQVERNGNNEWVGLSKCDGTFTYWNSNSVGVGPDSRYPHYLADVNGDGKADLIQIAWSGLFVGLANGPMPDLLTQINESLGASTSITYKPLTDAASGYTKGTGAVYPVVDLQPPLYVVSSTSGDSLEGSRAMFYFYNGLKAHQQGGGLLGFAKVTTQDPNTRIGSAFNGAIMGTETLFRQDYPFQGLPTQSSKIDFSHRGFIFTRIVHDQVVNTWTTTVFPVCRTVGFMQICNYYYHRSDLTQSVRSGTDLDGTALPTITTNTSYDAYGNPTSVAVSASDGFTKTTTNNYFDPDTVNWILGRVKQSTVTSTTP